MRGKRLRQTLTSGLDRITPAHAGKTRQRKPSPLSAADHPRACGENTFFSSLFSSPYGSPPRMRGKPMMIHSAMSHPRITPAHAGKTMPETIGALQKGGSPPRMRGKQAVLPLGLEEVRITPAHAGKTILAVDVAKSPADHPRACGENRRQRRCDLHCHGSPPRMRGKRGEEDEQTEHARITPAHAGKTRLSATSGCWASDHPRACGENVHYCNLHSFNSGSPPRMRGKHHRASWAVRPGRITPAHAGKTSFSRVARLQSSDHPRACGENHVFPPP